jgi:copper chaperone CopZ
MPEVTLQAPDIWCDHCIGCIEKAVTVECDSSHATMEEIGATMEDEGYPLKT